MQVTLRWVNPTAADLARVVVVLNLKHAPKNPSDGTKLYTGLATSINLVMRPGQIGVRGASSPTTRARTSRRRPGASSRWRHSSPCGRSRIRPEYPAAAQLDREGRHALLQRAALPQWQARPRRLARAFVVPPAGGQARARDCVSCVWPAVKGSNNFGPRIGRATFVLKG